MARDLGGPFQDGRPINPRFPPFWRPHPRAYRTCITVVGRVRRGLGSSMGSATKGFVSLIASVCTWLAERLYGDQIFGVLRAVTPSPISDAMLEVLTFGPPIVLLLVG